MRENITAERLRELMSYDPETGAFRWLVLRGNAKPSTAGSKHCQGYIEIGVDRRRFLAHRLAWLYVTGAMPDGEVDHINGDRSDNRFLNLRVVSREANMQNMKAAKRNNKCGLLGVTKKRGKFVASICTNNVKTRLGIFSTAEAAHEAYLHAKRQLHVGNTL